MRLLIVEDDPDVSDFVREGLTREGFTVRVARHGREALACAEDQEFDVVLLDVMMPHLDGLSVLKTLRSRGFGGAVLLVTSKGQERDKLEGFNQGADDYIVKPFLMSELIARVRAVMRRMSKTETIGRGSALRAGDLVMDLLKREVRRGRKAVALTKMEFDLLECLLRRPGQVLSQTVLCQSLFQNDFTTSTNTLEVHVRNLRRKLDKKAGKSLIRTVRGCGYALDL